MSTDVTLPQLGETVSEGTVIAWLVQPEQLVAEGEPLVEVSTDKVDSEIPSPVSGTVLEILAAEGATIEVGAVIARIGTVGDDPEGAVGVFPAAVKSVPGSKSTTPAIVKAATKSRTSASPAARRLARELNIDLASLTPTGPGSAITKGDVEAAAAASSAEPSVAVPVPEAQPVAATGQPSTPGPRNLESLSALVHVDLRAINALTVEHPIASFVIRALVDGLRETRISLGNESHPLEPGICHIDPETGNSATIIDAADLRLTAIAAGLAERSKAPGIQPSIEIIDCTASAGALAAPAGDAAISVTLGPIDTRASVEQTAEGVVISSVVGMDISLRCDSREITLASLNGLCTALKSALETRDWSAEL